MGGRAVRSIWVVCLRGTGSIRWTRSASATARRIISYPRHSVVRDLHCCVRLCRFHAGRPSAPAGVRLYLGYDAILTRRFLFHRLLSAGIIALLPPLATSSPGTLTTKQRLNRSITVPLCTRLLWLRAAGVERQTTERPLPSLALRSVFPTYTSTSLYYNSSPCILMFE